MASNRFKQIRLGFSERTAHAALRSLAAALLTLAAIVAAAPRATAADGSWNVDNAGNWNATGNWLGGSIPGSTSSTTSTDIATFGFPLTADRTLTVDSNRNIAGIIFSNTSAFRYWLSGGNLLLSNGGVIQTAANNGAHIDLIQSAIAIQGDGASATFTAGATNASSLLSIGAVTGVSTTGNTTTLTLNGANTGLNTIGGAIGNGANGGRLAVVKDGSGTWMLNGNNTFTGGLTVNSGVLYGRVQGTAFGAGAFTMNGGTVGLGQNQSSLTSSSLNGTVTLLSDADNPGAGGQRGFGGPATAIANNAVVNIGVGPNVTSGTASFALNGMNTAGNATFNIQNAVVSGTTVTGRLFLAGTSTFGTGTVTVTGNGQLFFNTPVSGSGGLTLDSNFTGSVTTAAASLGHTGPTVINSGTLQLGDGGNQGTLNAATVITNNGTLIWNRIGATAQTISNGIAGTGNVVLMGSGTAGQTNNVTFSGTNTYTGSTEIAFGTLTIGSAARLENSAIILSGTAVSVLNVSTTAGTALTIKSLSGVAGSSVTLGSKTLLVGDATSTTYAGRLSGVGGGLTKQGSGAMTLSGSNTYSGATTVSAGMLQFATTNALYGGTTANWTATNIRTGSAATLAFNVGGTGEFSTGNVTTLITNLAASSGTTNGMSAGSIFGFDTTNASGGTFTIADAIANTTGTSGGARGLRKLGTNTLLLTAANSFTGATSVEGGTLAFDRVAALNSSSGIGINAGAILDYTGTAATLSRNVTVATSGTGTIRNSGGQKLTLSGTLTKDGRVLRLTGGTFDVTGPIVGTSANSDLLVDGTSTVTLMAANTYNGPTFVNQASTLVLGTNSAIPSNSIVTLGNATTTGTLSLGTFTNSIGGLVFSGSGGTVRMAANQTASPQLSTASSLTLGSNASLDLAGMQTSAGNYRLISASSLSGTFADVTGLNSNYVLRYGTVNANEISAQRKAEFGTITATPASATIIVGGTTAFGFTVQNSAPSLSADLLASVSTGSNVIGSASLGAVAAGATSNSVGGLSFTSNTVGLGQTGSFTLTDADAIGSPANGTVTVNVLNHSLASFGATDTATKTLNFGTFDNGVWTGGDGGNGTLGYSIFNIASPGFTDAQTAGLNLYDLVFTSGNGGIFSLGYSQFPNLASGSSNGFSASVLSPGSLVDGFYTATYTLKFRDQQNLSGAANTRDLQITLSANVIVVPEPGAIALAGIGIAAAAYALRSKSPSRKRAG